MNAKDAILYLYDKGLLNIDAIMKNKDSIMQELDNTTKKTYQARPMPPVQKGRYSQVKRLERQMSRNVFRHKFMVQPSAEMQKWKP